MKLKPIKILVNFILFFFCVLYFGYAQKDTLNLSYCIETAINNNPQLKIAESTLGASEASYTSSKSVLYPQLSLQSNWIRNGGTFFFGPTSRPANYENYSAGLQMQQLLFDFGKSYSRISATENQRNASEEDYQSIKQNLILNTNIVYFKLLQARRIREVALEIVKQSEEHEKQAQGIYNVGKSSQYDLLKAKTDVANARVNLISAENDVRIAILQLKNILNTKISDDFELVDNLEVNQDSIDYNSALQIALNNRHEIKSGQYIVEANKSMVTSAWDANLPTLSGTAGYNWRSYSLDTPFLNSWSLGLNFSIPLFQGFAVDAAIDQQKSFLRASEASLEMLTQSVTLDVQQKYSNLREAKEKINATQQLVRQAEETLKLAEARYREGVGSPLEITDARVVYYNAKTSYIQSLYNYQVAFAGLQRAMGTLK